jgi:hypothetical protein
VSFDQSRPFRQGRQFGVCDVGINRAKACKCTKATVGPRYNSIGPDNINKPADPLRNKVWVLNEIGGRIHNAGHKDLVVGYIGFAIPEHGPFVAMAWI